VQDPVFTPEANSFDTLPRVFRAAYAIFWSLRRRNIDSQFSQSIIGELAITADWRGWSNQRTRASERWRPRRQAPMHIPTNVTEQDENPLVFVIHIFQPARS
jgi:hypothetical protein